MRKEVEIERQVSGFRKTGTPKNKPISEHQVNSENV